MTKENKRRSVETDIRIMKSELRRGGEELLKL